MSKRFIDTNLFNDEWFNSLSKDGKLFFVYIITTCDHAGIIKLNKKLCEFQTGIKSIETVIKELSNCLVTLKEGLYFLPKFLKFQYPGFPRSNVRQQSGAIAILLSHGLTPEKITEYLTVSKELTNSYVDDTVNENEDVKGGVGEDLSDMDKVFNEWIEYRSKIKKPIHKASLGAAKNKLIELSGNNPVTAKQIIEQSIANGWQGLFEIKTQKPNGKGTNPPGVAEKLGPSKGFGSFE